MSGNGRISPFSEDEFIIDEGQCYRAVDRILEEEASMIPGRSINDIVDIRAYQNNMLSKLYEALSNNVCEKDADLKDSIRIMLDKIKTVPENMMIKDQIRLKLQALNPTSIIKVVAERLREPGVKWQGRRNPGLGTVKTRYRKN